MTAPVGTHAFTSEESTESERFSRTTLEEILREPEFKDFSLVPYYSINQLYETKIATNRRRTHGTYDSLTHPDFGVIKYWGKVVGLGDNKYQAKKPNACERIALYTMDALAYGLSPKRVLVVLDGPGFEPWETENGYVHQATGKMLVRAMHHNTCLACPKNVTEVKNFFRNYLRMIVREENASGPLLTEAV
jgi:hypothetical protein